MKFSNELTKDDVTRDRLPITSTSTSNYLYLMGHRIQITLTNEQYAFLDHEADRSSVSIAELMRRAVESTYGIASPHRVIAISHTVGRRPGLPVDRRGAYGIDFD